MTQIEQIQKALKSFILQEFLPGEDPNELTDSTPLVSSGILDSLAILKLVTFLEEQFHVEVEAHETDEEHLNTIEAICTLVHSKTLSDSGVDL